MYSKAVQPQPSLSQKYTLLAGVEKSVGRIASRPFPLVFYLESAGYCLIFLFLKTTRAYVSTYCLFASARQFRRRFFRTFSRIRRNRYNYHYVRFIFFDLIFYCFL